MVEGPVGRRAPCTMRSSREVGVPNSGIGQGPFASARCGGEESSTEEGKVPGDSAIIIGAGLAGLAAGCYLQMNGYRARIFEQHTGPGGVAAAWKRKGYLIDGGIHFVMNFKPGSGVYEMYRELGVVQGNRFVEAHTYARFVDEVGERSLEVTQDLEEFARAVRVLSPPDGHMLDPVISGAQQIRGMDLSGMGLVEPPELMGMGKWLRTVWNMRRVLKYFVGSHRQPVGQFAVRIRDPWIRFVLENIFLPEVPLWFVVMLLALLANGDLGLLNEGSLGFVSAIETTYRRLGGEVSYRSEVQEVLVEEGAAVGVRLSDGSEHRSDVVVSAADGHTTIFGMLDGRYVDGKIRRMYDHWRMVRPMVMVSYGVARLFAGEPWLSIVALREPLRVGGKQIRAISLRIFNYSDHFAPPEKTVLQAAFETEWEHWARLHEDLQAYRDEKDRVASALLGRLEVHYPGISGQVEMIDVATPYTTWRYTGNRRGAYMGWLPTPEVLTSTVRRTLPGLENFVMAGQWVMPGGGAPGCLYSGRHVAQILCARDGKTFQTPSG